MVKTVDVRARASVHGRVSAEKRMTIELGATVQSTIATIMQQFFPNFRSMLQAGSSEYALFKVQGVGEEWLQPTTSTMKSFNLEPGVLLEVRHRPVNVQVQIGNNIVDVPMSGPQTIRELVVSLTSRYRVREPDRVVLEMETEYALPDDKTVAECNLVDKDRLRLTYRHVGHKIAVPPSHTKASRASMSFSSSPVAAALTASAQLAVTPRRGSQPLAASPSGAGPVSMSSGSPSSAKPLGQLFGQPLSKVLTGEALPKPVAGALALVRERYLDVVGIFRLSGSQSEIDALRAKWDAGEDVDLSTVRDPHVVCGLIKTWLRELPAPLCVPELYDRMIELSKSGAAMDSAALSALIRQLPSQNVGVIRELVAFLADVAAHADINKMPLQNLATVFGPIVFQCPADDVLRLVGDTPHINNLMSFLIANGSQLLPTTEGGGGGTANLTLTTSSGSVGTHKTSKLGKTSSSSHKKDKDKDKEKSPGSGEGKDEGASPSGSGKLTVGVDKAERAKRRKSGTVAVQVEPASPCASPRDGGGGRAVLPGKEYKFQSHVRAVYAYEPQTPQELALKEGDVIGVVQSHETGWWKGVLHDRVGLFPVTYCEEYDEDEAPEPEMPPPAAPSEDPDALVEALSISAENRVRRSLPPLPEGHPLVAVLRTCSASSDPALLYTCLETFVHHLITLEQEVALLKSHSGSGK